MTDLVARYFAPGDFPSGSSIVLDELTSLAFLAELRATGAITLEQKNTASFRPAVGGVVTIDVKGIRAFAARCTAFTSQTVAGNEDSQRTTWTMPGHLQVTAKGLIPPPNGTGAYPKVQHVAYNWTHFDFDDSAWAPAHVISSTFAAQPLFLNASATPWGGADQLAWYAAEGGLTLFYRAATGNPFVPAGPPDDTPILGPSDGTVTNVTSPNGTDQNHYFRQRITVPADARYSIHAAADNSVEIYIDGVLVFTGHDWQHDDFELVDLTAGDHVVAVFLQNIPQTTGNPCGFSWTLWFGNYPYATLAAHSDSSAVALEYQADPSGMTVTQALRLALQPHIDAGKAWATAITLNFDDVNDSNGNPMPIEPNLTAEVGKDSLLTLILKIQESYADVWMDPNSWTLNLYQFNSWAPVSGVALTYPGNILTLEHKGEEAPAEELLVDSELSWTQIGTGETQAYVAMGTEVAGGDIASRGAQILTIFGIDREEITSTYRPADDTEVPWVNADFVVGCTATAPDSTGAPTTERVLALGCSISQGSETMQVQITLKDRIQELNERIITELESK